MLHVSCCTFVLLLSLAVHSDPPKCLPKFLQCISPCLVADVSKFHLHELLRRWVRNTRGLHWEKPGGLSKVETPENGRLIFIHHQCWEVLPFCRFQRQRCIQIRVLRAQDFYTPLALKTAKGSTSQHWWCIKISLPDKEFLSAEKKPPERRVEILSVPL